jgi:hypothetical protein
MKHCVLPRPSLGIVDSPIVRYHGHEAARGEEGAEVDIDEGVGDRDGGEDAVAAYENTAVGEDEG